ncbi:MAG: ATP phosphoribosyltransferase regulatory subunit [Clostridia bacterium]|nr:ATP phosphoribosyltransferase regulatory subunit [Clostridia bacterium]
MSVMSKSEVTTSALRDLYASYGYAQYRMRKFEEYELYVRNKSFLISDHMITFTDREGRLMALKPDVTLSIVKSAKDSEGVEKVYYHESVYRVDKGSDSFHEITQVGLECIGDVDEYCVGEVLLLAQKSLSRISEDYVLDISHLGILSDLLDGAGLSAEEEGKLLACIGEKNSHGIATICRENGVDESKAAALCRLATLYGEADSVLPVLASMPLGEGGRAALAALSRALNALSGTDARGRVRVDFSVVNDMNYYSGIVFRGFVAGVPAGVLSGGEYDYLLRKMGKRGGAIGFAVYPDLLDTVADTRSAYDVDAVVLYDTNTDHAALRAAVDRLIEEGKRVLAARALPEKKTYRECYRLTEGGEPVHA